jgi:hypothetical protein
MYLYKKYALFFVYRSTKKWSDGGAVARLSSRLHKIKGALRAQPVEGHVYDSDLTLDLGESEFVSTVLCASDFRHMLLHHVHVVNSYTGGGTDMYGHMFQL